MGSYYIFITDWYILNGECIRPAHIILFSTFSIPIGIQPTHYSVHICTCNRCMYTLVYIYIYIFYKTNKSDNSVSMFRGKS